MEVLRSSFGNQVADRVELTAKNQGDEQSLCDKIIEVVKTILTTMVYYLTCTAVDLSEPKKTEEEEGGGTLKIENEGERGSNESQRGALASA